MTTEDTSSTTFNGLTKESIITIFNESKEESEKIAIEEFILTFNSGIIDYSILGYDLIKNTEDFYPVSEVFLIEKNKSVTVLNNPSIDMSLVINGNKLIINEEGTTKKTNKINPLDSVLLKNKNLTYSLESNWIKNTEPVFADTYLITIQAGLTIIVNDMVITI